MDDDAAAAAVGSPFFFTYSARPSVVPTPFSRSLRVDRRRPADPSHAVGIICTSGAKLAREPLAIEGPLLTVENRDEVGQISSIDP